ncbi:MAG: transglycosylase domain-containing protein [Anaerolineaceae bacterium]|nr:MAG: transglycosylase domain-containing protein [Anaerolineaceae bacterium]
MDDEFPNGPTEEDASDEITLNASSEGDNGEDAANRFRRLLADDIDSDTSPEPSSDSLPSPEPALIDADIPEEKLPSEDLETEPDIGLGPTETLPSESFQDRPPFTIPLLTDDEEETPLPQRVPERDLEATQVSSTAYVAPPETKPHIAGPPKSLARWDSCVGCLLRMGILALFFSVAVVIGVISFGVYQYYTLAASLPAIDDLHGHAAQFETTHILDREGNLLYEILDPQAGRRTYVPLDQISPYMVAAVVATEDSQFYSHPGYDLFAIARAFVQNYTQGEIVSGASTITQQIARMLLLSPEESYRRTARRKTREVLLAAEITRQYTKDEILEIYLNQVYFGNLAYGVEAAAETYFNTTAKQLTLSQASFLAGLLQAPAVYDIFTNRDATLVRQQQVLTLIMQTSIEQACIYVSNSQQPICITPEEAGAAAAELINFEFRPPAVQIRFPHWVFFIRSELERLYDPQTIYRSGFTVYTSIDPVLQLRAQELVQEQVEKMVDRRMSTGAVVAIRPNTGEILAMVGSADFYNEEIDGQVNMAIHPRQPGSSIKPLTYTAAFEKGWTPASLIWDVPSEFPPSGNPNDTRPPYKPVNYDERFHGPVTARSALANSYNVPAVKTLDFVGIYDDPDTPQEEGLVAFARRMGITTLIYDYYGLSLTLGGGEVTLLEHTGAYATFANSGLRIPPIGILRIVDHTGETVYEYEQPRGEQVIRAEHAFLITSILSDNTARTPAFGPNSALNLPFPVAAKTGTTDDFRDNWTLGYTPDIAVGVWVGNADNTPMQNTSGLTGAAPIWNQFMQFANQYLNGGQSTPFTTPTGIVDQVICAVSGTEPSEWCPSHRTELFTFDQPPLPKDQDLWRKVWVDSYSLEQASAECADFAVEKLGLSVSDPWGQKWIEEDTAGQRWAEEMGFEVEDLFFIPDRSCTRDSPRPIIGFTDPSEGSTVTTEVISIFGRAAATANFRFWELEYGLGYNPITWTGITRSETPHEQPDKLVDWDLSELPGGPITLRLAVEGTNGGYAEVMLHLTLNLPTRTPTTTPTPTPTPTPTSTSTNTETPTWTPSVTPSPVPSATPTATPSSLPTSTPSNTPSATPSPTPSPTPTPT